ncbi:hypothetical protein WS68_15750 [Burkholderia sp. TSV86]|nr:hypothetical protein WS68_15750 [Burkholderia sp. TSV86]
MAAPIEIKENVDITFSTFDFGKVRLINTKTFGQLRLGEACRSSQRAQMHAQRGVTGMMDGREHGRMLPAELE